MPNYPKKIQSLFESVVDSILSSADFAAICDTTEFLIYGKESKDMAKQYQKTESPRVIRTKGLQQQSNTESPRVVRTKGGEQEAYARSKKKGGLLKTAMVLLLVLILGVVGIGGYYAVTIGTALKDNSLDAAPEDLGIDLEDALFNDKDNESIVNIALFGVDQRKDEACRSDAIMVMSVDKKHGKIKLVSLMRDSLVSIDGYGQNKLAHAYFYGGPTLAIKTINQTFNLNIEEYVTVNFNELAQIVDAVGGVTVTVKEKECYYLNKNLREQAKYDNFKAKEYYIEEGGKFRLNGQQALAYARIRKLDSDFVRTDRQRTVLRQIFNEALSMSPLKYPDFAKDFLSICDTSLDMSDCISLAGIMTKNPDFVDVRLPLNEDMISGDYRVNGISYVYYDTAATASKLRDFIYNDVIPEEANTGKEDAETKTE